MRRLIISILSVLILGSLGYAQTLNVTTSDPLNGAVSVDDTTTVTFFFSEAINVDFSNPEGPGVDFIVFPFEGIEFINFSTDVDSTSISFEIVHSMEGNYMWTIFGATSKTGVELSNPYLVQYTTADAQNPRTVEGTVTDPSAFLSPVGIEGTIVYLFNSNPFAESDCDTGCEDGPDLSVEAAGVVNPIDGSFVINSVSSGTYFPLGINLKVNSFYEQPTFLAIYDPDGDGTLNTLTVEDTDISGLALNFQPLQSNTALTNLEDALTEAGLIDADLELLALGGVDVLFDDFQIGGDEPQVVGSPNGTAESWGYFFYSSTSDFAVVINFGPFGTLVIDTLDAAGVIDALDIDSFEDLENFDIVPDDQIIDSDQALAIAEINGGEDFRLEDVPFSLFEVEYFAYKNASFNPGIIPAGATVWEVIYIRETVDEITQEYLPVEFSVFIDAITGVFLGSELDEPSPITFFELKDEAANLATAVHADNIPIILNSYAVIDRDPERDFNFKVPEVKYERLNQDAIEGKFGFIDHLFYSASADTTTFLVADSFGDVFFPDYGEFGPPELLPDEVEPGDLALIDCSCLLDSDAAMAIIEANGGLEFREQALIASVAFVRMDVNLQLGNLFWMYPPEVDSEVISYTAFYNRTTQDLQTGAYFFDGANVVINAQTGEVISSFIPVSNEDNPDLPTETRLLQNYPNPFNPSTTIPFELNAAGDVQLSIFNLLGQEVATLIDGNMTSGMHTIQWDAAGFSSGVYFYQLRTDQSVQTRKLLLVK